MNLIWSTSDKYSEIAATSIASVLENSQDADDINVYVIDMGLTQMHKSWIEELVSSYGRTLIWLEKLNIEKLTGTHIDVGRWHISTFSRLFLSHILPSDVEKIIYIDCDMIVRHSLKPLWEMDMNRGCVNPIGIRSCYDEGKRCAESLCFDYNREFGTKIKVIRIFNTYGPKMDPNDGRVVSNFIIQALKGEDITIYGDGTQTRSFQYIDDLIEGIFRMMNMSRDEFLGPVNLGNHGEFTMIELAEKVINLTGSKSKLVFMPLPSDDPTRRQANTDVAFKELQGWTSKITLEEGLIKTIPYFKSIIG